MKPPSTTDKATPLPPGSGAYRLACAVDTGGRWKKSSLDWLGTLLGRISKGSP